MFGTVATIIIIMTIFSIICVAISSGMTRLQHTTGATLMPILENIERATHIKTLYLSCTHVSTQDV